MFSLFAFKEKDNKNKDNGNNNDNNERAQRVLMERYFSDMIIITKEISREYSKAIVIAIASNANEFLQTSEPILQCLRNHM